VQYFVLLLFRNLLRVTPSNGWLRPPVDATAPWRMEDCFVLCEGAGTDTNLRYIASVGSGYQHQQGAKVQLAAEYQNDTKRFDVLSKCLSSGTRALRAFRCR
jgi:hypothetical protein